MLRKTKSFQFGNSQCEHQKDFIPPFASLFSDKQRVNLSFPFVVSLRQTGEKEKGRTDLTGKGVIEKKKNENVIATTKTPKMYQFC